MTAPEQPSQADDERKDDATILPGGDADRTVPGPASDDRTMPSGDPRAGAPQPPARGDRIPDHVGDCRVEKRLGTGGFGDVLLGVQETDLLKRRVAIKLLKRGMDSESVLERFRVERKVLDTLNHPNIARLLGGGETDDGRSYLVMEFVDGLTLDLWCERQALDLQGRLGLLKQVASALAHAHEKGIVHRDLKPANVLVGTDGVPKLLDFGIAKIITPGVAESERSHLTMPGETGPLTTAYASPEQLRGEPLGPATDIYSFGVMMYEVLSGQPPFDFSKSSFDEIRRRVCQQTPPLPSAAADRGAKTATDPRTTSGSMRRSLRGDVDNIVMMAMRKEPTRRYASMAAIIDDIDAYLGDRPVHARPNSIAYRLTKGLVRNRWRVAVAGALVLAVAIAATWWGLSRLRAQQRYDEAMGRVNDLRKDENWTQDPGRLRDLEEAARLAEARVHASPGDVKAARDLLLALSQMSELHEATRNLQQGLGVSDRLVQVARTLRQKQGDPEDRQNLVLALQKRGDLLLRAGEREKAREVYAEGLDERRKLSAEKPDDLQLLQSVSLGVQRMREIALDGADFQAAVKFDRELKEARGRVMRAMGPAGAVSREDAAAAAKPAAGVKETKQQKAEREEREKQAKERVKQAKERDKAERQWMLASVFLAADLLALDQLAEAESEALSARDIARTRLERDRKDWRGHADAALVQEILSMVAYQRSDLAAAQAELEQWVSRARAAVEASSASSMTLGSLFDACVEQARVRNDLGRHAEALEGLQAVLDSVDRYRSGKSGAKGEAVTPGASLRASAQQMRALRGLGRLADARALLVQVQGRIAAPNEGRQWHLGRSDAAREASRCAEDPAAAARLAGQAVESSKLCGDALVVAEAQFALHDALVAAGRAAEADAALEAARAAAKSSDTPRAKAMLARMTPPPAAPAPSAPVAAPPAGGGKAP